MILKFDSEDFRKCIYIYIYKLKKIKICKNQKKVPIAISQAVFSYYTQVSHLINFLCQPSEKYKSWSRFFKDKFTYSWWYDNFVVLRKKRNIYIWLRYGLANAINDY